MSLNAYAQRLEAHYQSLWGPILRTVRWSRGPVDDLGPEFAVLVFGRVLDNDYLTYVTRCMSRPDDVPPVELVARSPWHFEEIIEALTVTAHYHRTGATLGPEHTVNLGQPWCEGSSLTHGLLSLPYFMPPEQASVDNPGKEWSTRVLWFIPISNAEREFKRSNGFEALWQAFEKCNIGYDALFNPTRACTISGRANQ